MLRDTEAMKQLKKKNIDEYIKLKVKKLAANPSQRELFKEHVRNIKTERSSEVTKHKGNMGNTS